MCLCRNIACLGFSQKQNANICDVDNDDVAGIQRWHISFWMSFFASGMQASHMWRYHSWISHTVSFMCAGESAVNSILYLYFAYKSIVIGMGNYLRWKWNASLFSFRLRLWCVSIENVYKVDRAAGKWLSSVSYLIIFLPSGDYLVCAFCFPSHEWSERELHRCVKAVVCAQCVCQFSNKCEMRNIPRKHWTKCSTEFTPGIHMCRNVEHLLRRHGVVWALSISHPLTEHSKLLEKCLSPFPCRRDFPDWRKSRRHISDANSEFVRFCMVTPTVSHTWVWQFEFSARRNVCECRMNAQNEWIEGVNEKEWNRKNKML